MKTLLRLGTALAFAVLLAPAAVSAASPSCTISSSVSSVQSGQKFTIKWDTRNLETSVMMIDDGMKHYALAGTSGTAEFTAGPKAPQYIFTVGYGASGVAPFSPVCSVTVSK